MKGLRPEITVDVVRVPRQGVRARLVDVLLDQLLDEHGRLITTNNPRKK